MRTLVLLVVCLVSLAGCEYGRMDDMSPSDSYLPLQVGNSWKLVSTNNLNPSHHYNFKRVTAEVEHEGYTWFEVVSGYANPNEIIGDTSYYRIDDDGFVYIRPKRGETTVQNKFRLKGVDGDSWSYEIDGADFVIQLSELSLQLGSQKLVCKAYYSDVQQWADEEYTITLARGIGFAKEYSDAWSNGSVLKEAVINGRTISF